MMTVRLFIGALAFALSLPVAAVGAGEVGVWHRGLPRGPQ
jgi:hypothetical protein